MSRYVGVYGVDAYGTFDEVGVVFEVATYHEAVEQAVEWYKENAYGKYTFALYHVRNNGNEDLIPYERYRDAVCKALEGTPDPYDYYLKMERKRVLERAVAELVDSMTSVDALTGYGVM